MKLQKLLIVLILLVSLIPPYYINKWLQKILKPRRSFAQLILYILLAFVLVFAYTFLLVTIISNLFPVAKR